MPKRARSEPYDAFISHASEDKDDFVRPLAEFLDRAGLSVWYDEFSLSAGDSLSRSIDKGLARSRFGIVVLSNSFLQKRWPEYELRGLAACRTGLVEHGAIAALCVGVAHQAKAQGDGPPFRRP